MDPYGISKDAPSPTSPTYSPHQRQTVPLAEEFDSPPSYDDSQVHSLASSSSAAAVLTPPSRSHAAGSARSSVSSNAGEDTPLNQAHSTSIHSNPTHSSRTSARVSTDAYRCPKPMSASAPQGDADAKRKGLEDQPGCCFSTSGGCCFSTTGGCCFSDHGGCCFSSDGGCCFSSHDACCFSGGASCGSCSSGKGS